MATPSTYLPGEHHGQRSLAGYGLWGHKESDTTEQLGQASTHRWVVRCAARIESSCFKLMSRDLAVWLRSPRVHQNQFSPYILLTDLLDNSWSQLLPPAQGPGPCHWFYRRGSPVMYTEQKLSPWGYCFTTLCLRSLTTQTTMGHHHVTSVSREVTRPALAKLATVFPDSSESRGTDSPAALHLHQLHPLLGKLSLHGRPPCGSAVPSLPRAARPQPLGRLPWPCRGRTGHVSGACLSLLPLAQNPPLWRQLQLNYWGNDRIWVNESILGVESTRMENHRRKKKFKSNNFWNLTVNLINYGLLRQTCM